MNARNVNAGRGCLPRGLRQLLLIASAWLLLGGLATAAAVRDSGSGLVVGVIDGDTVDVLLTAEEAMAIGMPRRKSPVAIRLRLDQVDTPERGQAWANRAKQALSDLVFGQVVRFEIRDVDRYERGVADLFAGDTWVNAWLIENGHGWVYRRYVRQATLLCGLEDDARASRQGLWSQPESSWIPPSRWRRKDQRIAPDDISRAECLQSAESHP